jgi:hypothetical protein
VIVENYFEMEKRLSFIDKLKERFFRTKPPQATKQMNEPQK